MTLSEEPEGLKEYILVSAQNDYGNEFLKALHHLATPFAVLTESTQNCAAMDESGIKNTLTIDMTNDKGWVIPEFPVGKVYLFERSLPLICRYIQICRSWTRKSIYVITQNNNSRAIYRELGADYIIQTRSHDVSFLLDDVKANLDEQAK